MNTSNPVSPKIVAAAAGAGAGAVVSQLAVWLIGAALFGGGWSADQVDNAIAAVPTPVYAFVVLVVTVIGAAVPGYRVTDPLREVGRKAAAESRIGA